MTGCCKKCLLVFAGFVCQLFLIDANAQQLVRPPINGIAYVELQVSDVSKAMAFYKALMGYRVVCTKTLPGASRQLCTVAINQRQSIQLQDGLPAGQDERLRSLAFQTTDAAAMRSYLQSKGIAVPPAVTKEAGTISFTVADPDNHPIMFIQYLTNAAIQTQSAPSAAISHRILHAGLTIASAKAANTFYADVLGFSEIWRGGSNDSVTSWINMRVPEGTDYLEYMLVNGPVSRQQLGSLHHIALMVPDMQRAVDWLAVTSRKTDYTVAAPRIGRNNRWQLNLFDPDGTRIELMEPFTMR